MCAAIAPNEAYPPLIIDPYAVLSFSVSGQGFQPIPRWNAEIFDVRTAVQHPQLPEGRLLNISRQPPRILTTADRFGFLAPETFYHVDSI
jgi:hypothetical protein